MPKGWQNAGRPDKLFEVFSLWSSCAADNWLEEMQEFSPGGTKVLINAGCNKGYNVGEYVELYAPELGVTNKALLDSHTQTASRLNVTLALCGSCDHCRSTQKSKKDSRELRRDLQVYCIEPGSVNFKLLHAAVAAVTQVTETRQGARPMAVGTSSRGAASLKWAVLRAAAGNRLGTTQFSANCSTEDCTVAGHGDEVHMITVDRLMAKHSIEHVDVLKVDTEGYDPIVLYGASRALANGRVDVVEFEYHGMHKWHEISLESVVDWLLAMRYVCYLLGPRLTRLSACWAPGYEFKYWSNVLCIHESHPLARRWEARAYTADFAQQAEAQAQANLQ